MIAERDEHGKPYVPTFYTSRKYVDLSTNDAYSENLEVLVRAIYGQPLHKKPPLGKKPAFLNETTGRALSSPLLYNRATNFLKEGKPQALSSMREYLKDTIGKFETYRISENKDLFFDDQVMESIELFLPHRNEVLQLIKTGLAYANAPDVCNEIHSFLEGVIKYTKRPEGISSYKLTDYDNFMFFAKELFLNIVAILIKEEKFIDLDRFLSKGFYFKDDDYPTTNLHDYSAFTRNCGSLEFRKQRLGLNRTSLEADLLKERSFSSPVSFDDLMQADFTLVVRSKYLGIRYWPDTLAYLTYHARPFEKFARSASRSYFENFKTALGVSSKNDLITMADQISLNQRSWGHQGSLKGLLNIEEIGTRP